MFLLEEECDFNLLKHSPFLYFYYLPSYLYLVNLKDSLCHVNVNVLKIFPSELRFAYSEVICSMVHVAFYV